MKIEDLLSQVIRDYLDDLAVSNDPEDYPEELRNEIRKTIKALDYVEEEM